MTSLHGKLAFVSGASAGIGAATARSLVRAGAHVLIAARRMDRLQSLAAELGDAEALALDVRDAGAVAAALESRPFDVVVANAGLALGTEPLHRADPGETAEMLDTNVKGVLHVIRSTLPTLLARGSGDLVLLGSVAGRQVYPGGNVYCATKHALHALYQSLRLDHVGSGVRFTTVDPGLVASDFSRVRFHGDQQKADAVYTGMTPLDPTDVADAVLYAITRPAHVNVGEIVLWPTDQASTQSVHRE